jgi:fucose 4-O-acetylase-like acetyltransferase
MITSAAYPRVRDHGRDDRPGHSNAQATTVKGQRSIYLDALRAVALSRVVLYHAVDSEWVTLFTAMPLMFFIAGALFASSVDRRPGRSVILDRYRRILLPYWIYAAAMVALWVAVGAIEEMGAGNWIGILFPVLAPEGPEGPGRGTELELTWIALWYLQFHLVLSLLGPWLRRVQKSRPLQMWATIGVVFLVGFALGSGIVVVIVYTSCWLLGYHYHDGDLQRAVRRWWRIVCVVSGPVGLGLFVAFEPGSADSGGALRLAFIGAVLLGVFWLTLAVALRPTIEPMLDRRVIRGTVHWFSQRSLTIYMWHLVAIYAAVVLDLPGTTNWGGTLAWCIPLTVLAVVAVGWAEDLAARRSPTLWPRSERVVRSPA